jgi:large subunit ribosomal protein L15
MFKLNNLRSPVGSNHAPKRKGKGIGSGLGKTAGRGHKGQRARSGGNVGQVFEGGQMPMARRSPKIGFNSPLLPNKIEVNITELGNFAGRDLLLKDLIPSIKASMPRCKVRVVGTRLPKVFPKSLEAHYVSPKAKALLETKGVGIKIVDFKDGSRILPRNKKGKKK